MAAGDAPDPFPRKHPLESGWSLWFAAGKTELKRVPHTVDNVEDFWCLHANCKQPSALPPPSTLAFFKDGITPKWEDPANVNGGCWTVIAPRVPNANELLDNWWLQMLLSCIGEAFESDEVCGATVSIRHGKNRIELWTRTAANEAAQIALGKQVKAILKTPDNIRIGYAFFSDKMQQGKTRDRYHA